MSEIAKAAAVVALVSMVRDEPQFPGGPLSAEVHPDEVDNFTAAGWYPGEPVEPQVVVPVDVNLDEMDVEALRAFAAEHNIRVSNNPATGADKLRAKIREAFASVEQTVKNDPDGQV